MRRFGPKPTNEVDRFWSKVRWTPHLQCWEWTGLKSVGGYGRFYRADRTQIYAHRYAWEWSYQKPVPNGMYVCHHCDNPACVKPSHLFVGTQTDNMQDCVRKGRQLTVPLKGAANGRARLTAADVERIRREYQPGNGAKNRGNSAELAREYGVTTKSILNAAQGRTWKS